MKATIYIPEKYLNEVTTLRIGEETKKRIRTTRNVGKSKPCIFEIRNQNVLRDLDVVMPFKIRAK